MTQAPSRTPHSSGSSFEDPLHEVRRAVRADRRKIASVPVGRLELKVSDDGRPRSVALRRVSA